jgi:hypothetical protein
MEDHGNAQMLLSQPRCGNQRGKWGTTRARAEGMVADGCRTERFKDSHDSSWRIIDGLVETGRTQDPLSRESVDLRLATIENKIGQMSD